MLFVQHERKAWLRVPGCINRLPLRTIGNPGERGVWVSCAPGIPKNSLRPFLRFSTTRALPKDSGREVTEELGFCSGKNGGVICEGDRRWVVFVSYYWLFCFPFRIVVLI